MKSGRIKLNICAMYLAGILMPTACLEARTVQSIANEVWNAENPVQLAPTTPVAAPLAAVQLPAITLTTPGTIFAMFNPATTFGALTNIAAIKKEQQAMKAAVDQQLQSVMQNKTYCPDASVWPALRDYIVKYTPLQTSFSSSFTTKISLIGQTTYTDAQATLASKKATYMQKAQAYMQKTGAIPTFAADQAAAANNPGKFNADLQAAGLMSYWTAYQQAALTVAQMQTAGQQAWASLLARYPSANIQGIFQTYQSLYAHIDAVANSRVAALSSATAQAALAAQNVANASARYNGSTVAS